MELANDLRLACQRIARRVRFEATASLAPHQLSVLFLLIRHGDMTPTELAHHERVSTPSMTRTVNVLADEGLVERHPDPKDGRRVQVRLAAAGRELAEQAVAHRDSWMLHHIEGLDEDQLEVLRRAADLLLEVSHAD